MKITGSTDWREQLPFDVPVLVADVVPGDPTRCSGCGVDSALHDRTELWAVRRRNPQSHAGVVRFHCAAHLPPPPAPVGSGGDSRRRLPAARTARAAAPRTASRRPAVPERVAPVCPSCFIEVPSTGVCGMCGERIA
ncbi:MAG TPA: glucose-6-phosphate dehydrogenase, partial [Microbacterium sp.]|nr:glucose-6-phosphate dehydrogenase [Microbacterium sp.]